MKSINVSRSIHLIFLVLKNNILLRLATKIYYILRISFLIDEIITVKNQFKKRFILGFFRIFKVIYKYYNYDLPLSKYKIFEKFKFNIVSVISKFFTASKVPYHCFEVCKKVDDIFFILSEIKGRIRMIQRNLKEFCINVCLIMLKLFNHCFFLVCFKIYLFQYERIIEIIVSVLFCFFVGNLFYILKILKNMDDIMISGYKVYMNFRMLRSFMIGAMSMERLPFGVVMIYNGVYRSLKVTRKLSEIVIFTAKISKKLNEISIMILKKLNYLEGNIEEKVFSKKAF